VHTPWLFAPHSREENNKKQSLRRFLRKLHDSVKCWETIADNLSKSGFSFGVVLALDLQSRTIWIVDAHGYGKRFISAPMNC
jgi:hypothetical protein